MEDLPIEMFDIICGYLGGNDLKELALACSRIYEYSLQTKYGKLRHICIKEIEDSWNGNVDRISFAARNHYKNSRSVLGFDNNFNIQMNPEEEIKCYKSENCYGSTAEQYFDVECSVFEDCWHKLSLKYIHNPRDVDILIWSQNNKVIGHTML